MNYSEIIYLIDSNKEFDDIGNFITMSETKKKSYAKKQSVRTNEYYSAIETGLKPTCEFVLKRLNYNNQDELEYNKERYQVIRTVDPKNQYDIVLVCSKKIGVNG